MSWSYSGVAASVALQVVASVVFARLLGAHVTGVFAFGLLVFPPFKFLCEFGLGSALIEKSAMRNNDIQSALSRSAVLAVLTSVAWLLSINLMVSWVHQEQYVVALSCFALVLLCLPVQTICTSLLTKNLDQKYLQVSSLVAYAVGYLGVGTFGALHGWGVWSLVLGFLSQNVIATVMLLTHTELDLTLGFESGAGSLWRFGSRATAINTSNWLTSSLDNMAVAWFFGATTLGIYSVAYTLVRTPADRMVATLQNVLFPASVLARDDKERLTKGCVAALDAVFLLTAPAFCTAAVLSRTIIGALYGAGWASAAWVLPPLALSMIFHCLVVVISALLWGSGGVSRDMRIQWWSAGMLLLGVVTAAQISFVAVAWTVLPVTVLRAILGLRALVTTLGIDIHRILRGLLGGAVMIMIVTPTLFMVDNRLGGSLMHPAVRLGLEVMAGGLLWLGAVGLLHTRLMTPELQAGLRSLRIAAGMGKSHA